MMAKYNVVLPLQYQIYNIFDVMADGIKINFVVRCCESWDGCFIYLLYTL